MTRSASQLISELAPDSLQIKNTSHQVRVDGDPPLVDREYLQIHGTPAGFRWLAQLLTELASNADCTPFDQVLVSDQSIDTVSLDGWDCLHLECERKTVSDAQ